MSFARWWNKLDSDVEFTTPITLNECEQRLKWIGAKTLGGTSSKVDFRWYGNQKKNMYWGFLLQGPALIGNVESSSSGVIVKAYFFPSDLSFSIKLNVLLFVIFLAFSFIKIRETGLNTETIKTAIFFTALIGIVGLSRGLFYHWCHSQWGKLAVSLKEILLAPTYYANGDDSVWMASDSIFLILLGIGIAIVLVLLFAGIILGSKYLFGIVIY